MEGTALITVWFVFASIFLVASILALVQTLRAIYVIKKEKTSLPTVLWVNTLAFIASLSRSILLFIFAGAAIRNQALKNLIEPWAGYLLSTLPPMCLTLSFFMILFLLMSFTQGPSVGQMRKSGMFGFLGKMSGKFLIAVALEIVTLVVLVFGSLIIQETARAANRPIDPKDPAILGINVFAMIVFIAVPVILVILYWITTRSLVRQLSKFSDLSDVNKTRIRGLHRRAALFSFALLGTTIMTFLIGFPDPSNQAFVPIYVVDTMFEVVCIAFLLYFHKTFPSRQKFLKRQTTSVSMSMPSARSSAAETQPNIEPSPFSSGQGTGVQI